MRFGSLIYRGNLDNFDLKFRIDLRSNFIMDWDVDWGKDFRMDEKIFWNQWVQNDLASRHR